MSENIFEASDKFKVRNSHRQSNAVEAHTQTIFFARARNSVKALSSPPHTHTHSSSHIHMHNHFSCLLFFCWLNLSGKRMEKKIKIKKKTKSSVSAEQQSDWHWHTLRKPVSGGNNNHHQRVVNKASEKIFSFRVCSAQICK